MSIHKQLITEKFRPQSLEEIILPKRIRDIIGTGELNTNYLLSGSAGLGKTSLAKILAKNYPTLYINVSDESSVDIIRDKITNWCSSISILDNAEQIKVIILDEMDGASDQFYKALRATIERFAFNTRFIGTCNYINKLPDPVQSRFTTINFDILDKEEEREIKIQYIKRCSQIFKHYGIEIELEALKEFVKRNFPDFRKILNKIQAFVNAGITTIQKDQIKKLNYSFRDVFEQISKAPSPLENYQFLSTNYSQKVDDILEALGSEFPKYLEENLPSKVSKVPQILIKVAYYQSQRVTVIDPFVSLLACFFEIQQILNS